MGSILFAVLFALGFILALVGGIMGLVEAFRTSTLWGILYLFVPFAALVFVVKFWSRKRVRNSFLIGLGGTAVMIISGVLGFFDSLGNQFQMAEESPSDLETSESDLDGVPLPAEGEPGQDGQAEEFTEPIVPAAPSIASIASAELIQSTDPNERVRQVTRSRTDPYATLPIPPKPTPVQPPATGPATTGGGGTPAGGQTSPGGTTTAGDNGPAPGNGQAGGTATASNGGSRIQPLPALPKPDLAAAVEITGVVRIGNDDYAILKAPGEGVSRYVKVGQRVANGRILLKRIQMRGAEPIVILEENGIEVARPVGAPAEDTEETPTARNRNDSLPPLSVPPQPTATTGTTQG